MRLRIQINVKKQGSLSRRFRTLKKSAIIIYCILKDVHGEIITAGTQIKQRWKETTKDLYSKQNATYTVDAIQYKSCIIITLLANT